VYISYHASPPKKVKFIQMYEEINKIKIYQISTAKLIMKYILMIKVPKIYILKIPISSVKTKKS